MSPADDAWQKARKPRAGAGIAKAGEKDKKMPRDTMRVPRGSGRYALFQSTRIGHALGPRFPPHTTRHTSRTGFKRRREIAMTAASFRNAPHVSHIAPNLARQG
ncbi:hypothetical protein I7824_05815 [Burkholderia seminalis]|nr:hypothetical protein [Burkholderia seminalis]